MSEIKVNKISPRTACGTTTLGDSGDTFTIPAGVTISNSGTASGFGATGAVSWNTTVKTSGFTAVAGEGYFVNTTGGAVSVNLPAGTAGAVVGFKDYAKTFDTNAVTLVFIDSTQGWLVTDSGLQSDASTAQYIVATGGTITTCGNFKVHKFTGPGTFTVSSVGNPEGSTTADYLIVGGGGSGAPDDGGGGGAGGMRFSATTYTSPSPLAAPAAFTVSATGYPVVVGAGGAGTSRPPYGPNGNAGNNSSVFSLTSAGGGFGASNNSGTTRCGGPGGSGGGSSGPSCGGAGNTPPVSPPQGNNGGSGPQGSGGGGIGGVGANGTASGGCGNAGGVGLALTITGSCVTYAAGGRGDVGSTPTPNEPANSGNGSDGICAGSGGTGSGGSGIVVIRYKFQN